MTLIVTSGKRDKIVLSIFSVSIEMKLGVNKEKHYIFARTNFNSLNCQRASVNIRKAAIDASLKEPKLITSAILQKHIATMLQLFSLKDYELYARHKITK